MNTIVSADWLNEHLNDSNLIVLDASIKIVSGNKETAYPNTQILGARFFDLKKVFSDQMSELPNTLPQPDDFAQKCRELGIHQNSQIVVYDNLGIYSSPRIWWMFKAMGHDQVAVLDGGLPAWMEKEYPSETSSIRTYEQGDFIANFNRDLVWDVDQVKLNINKQEAKVLDARGRGRFNGTSPEPREGLKSGHIPNSISLPYAEVLKDGHFLSIEALQEKFSSLSLQNQPLVFSCGSGLTACITALASQLVQDNPIAIYDGSWSEWGMLAEEWIEI